MLGLTAGGGVVGTAMLSAIELTPFPQDLAFIKI
jgi:hypothetical protein